MSIILHVVSGQNLDTLQAIMIYIHYKLSNSNTHGIGLFTNQDIAQGDYIYTPSPLLDSDITDQDFNTLSSAEQEKIMYYGYFNLKTKKWHVAFDAIRFLNHSDNPNVTQNEEMVMTALRDIRKGEELLQNYNEIYQADSEHFLRINKNI